MKQKQRAFARLTVFLHDLQEYITNYEYSEPTKDDKNTYEFKNISTTNMAASSLNFIFPSYLSMLCLTLKSPIP